MNIFHPVITAHNMTNCFIKYNCPRCKKYHIYNSNNDLSNRKIVLLPSCVKKSFLSFFKRIVVSINNDTIKYH